MKKVRFSNFQKVRFDFWFTVIFVAIIGFGTSMIFSASSVRGMEETGSMFYFLKKHMVNLILGVGVFYVAASFKYQNFRKYLIHMNVFAIFLMLLVFVPALNNSVNGAGRWVSLGPIGFQPSEIAKVVIIVTLAHIIDKKRRERKLNSLKEGILPVALYIGLYVAIVLAQTHLSATGLILLISLTMLLIGGLAMRYMILAAIPVIAIAILGVILEPFRMQRILGFMNPLADQEGKGFHITQSWFGLGSGEWFGLGLGMSRQKFSWLPENHTDFIVAIVGEEVGFVGIVLLAALFVFLIVRGLGIAMKAPDFFGAMIVIGVLSMMFFQTLLNFLVVIGWFPVTGVPIPFVSYGGTSTIVLFGAMGLIYNVMSQMVPDKEESQERA